MSTQTASASSAAAVLEILSGYWSSRAVYAAAKLGIADLIQDGPKTAAELASRTETHPPSLYRLLRALASIGWLTEDEGRFGPTPLTAGIQSGVPGSLRNLAITELGQEHYPLGKTFCLASGLATSLSTCLRDAELGILGQPSRARADFQSSDVRGDCRDRTRGSGSL